MKTSTTGKKHTRATVENNFFKILFLNFLNIRKDYCKPQLSPLKGTTENITVSFREPV